MRKYIVTFLVLFGVMCSGTVSASLWDYYSSIDEELPSLSERARLFSDISEAEYIGSKEQNNFLERYLRDSYFSQPEEVLGGSGTLPVAGVTYSLAGSGVTASATSITLSSLTIPQTGYPLQDSDFSTTFYITFEPGNTKRQEISSCTTVTQNGNGTATLSGCSRGLLPFTPFTASSTYAFSHAGGTSVIFSDPPQLFNEFASKSNTETINQIWTFTVHPESSSSLGLPTSTYQYVTKQYADNLSNQGAATSTESNAGVVELGTLTEIASSTDYGVNMPLVLQAKYATSTPYADSIGAGYSCVTENDGNISADCLPTSESIIWTGESTYTASTTFNKLVVDGDIEINNVISNSLVNGDNADLLHKHAYSKLFQSSTTQSSVASTVDVPFFATTTIPANTLGENNVIRFKVYIPALTWTNGNTKTFKVRYGASGEASITFTNSSGGNFSGTGYIQGEVIGAGTTGTQIATINGFFGDATFQDAGTDERDSIGYAQASISVDSTQPQPFVVLTSQSVADSMTGGAYYIEILD